MDKIISAVFVAIMCVIFLIVVNKLEETIDAKQVQIDDQKLQLDALNGVYLNENDLCEKVN